MRKIDLQGQKIGKLTVLYQSEKRGKRNEIYWHCKCDCGQEKDILSSSLIKKIVKSCGFCKERSKKIIELAGRMFGKLLVLKEHGRTKRQQVTWLCRCECGKESVVSSNDLISGQCQSCGCSRKYKFGEKAPSWKGGLTATGKLIRNHIKKSTSWTQDVLSNYNYTCARCGKRGGRLHAHHLVRLSEIITKKNIKTTDDIYKNNDILFDVENGICLCTDCHRYVHTKRNTTKEYIIEYECAS